MSFFNRNALLVGTALVAVTGASVAVPVQAQSTTPQSAEESTSGLEDIVVTAQRRRENLQDVPISVTAITARSLGATGIQSTLSLPQVVPSVQMTRSGPSAIFFIRGVGNTSGGTGEEGANAFYIDGVYMPDIVQANTEFNNIERVEVLKGPQGTLFGRNSSGGLVNVITRDPGDEVVVKGNVGYGNYQTFRGQLYVASPLTEKLSADIALSARDQNKGFGKNVATGKDNMDGWYVGARSKIVWRPTEAAKITFGGDYWHSRDTFGNGFTIVGPSVAAAPASAAGQPGVIAGPTPGTFLYSDVGPYNRNSINPGYADIEVWGLSATAEIDLDWANLTNIAAIRRLDALSNIDSDYGPSVGAELRIPSLTNTFQEELRLASQQGGPLNWQVGLFYYRAKAGVKDQRTFIGSYTSGQITNSIMKTRSYAAFGEVSYDITPTTHLTGGLRYTKEKRTLDAQQFSFTPTTTTLILAAPLVNKIDFNRVTYRAAIRQDITDDINIYASYNRGFKSGLWAIQSPGGPPVKPQTTDAFEVGIKSELFDRLLRFNLAGYHYKIKDYQIRAAPGNAANPILLNATSVKVNGIEGEVQLAPAQGLLFTGNFNYLPKSKFGTFNGAPFTFPNTVLVPASTPAATACASPNLGLGARTGGNRTCLMSATGLRTPLSPKFTMSAGMSYTTPVGNDGELSFNLLFSHNSGYYFEQDNRLEQGSFQVVNGSIGWKVTKNWGVELWAKNIGKEKYYITKLGSGTADHGELQPPRTYGMNFTFDF